MVASRPERRPSEDWQTECPVCRLTAHSVTRCFRWLLDRDIYRNLTAYFAAKLRGPPLGIYFSYVMNGLNNLMQSQRINRVFTALYWVGAALAILTLVVFAVLAAFVFQSRVSTQALCDSKQDPCGRICFVGWLYRAGGSSECGMQEDAHSSPHQKQFLVAGNLGHLAYGLHPRIRRPCAIRPEGNRWISTGRAGPWAVSESVARQYL